MGRRAFAALVAVVLLIGQLGSTLAAGAPGGTSPDALVQARVQSGLLERLERGEIERFIVEFSARPNLARARTLRTREARGAFVHQALRSTAQRAQAAAVRIVQGQPGVRATRFWLRNTLLVEATGATGARIARRLAVLSGVTAVRAERVYPLVKPVEMKAATLVEADAVEAAWGVAKIGAPEVWATGNTGSGVVVANVDTGVDYLHPALINQYRGNLGDGVFDHDYDWWDPTGMCGDAPCDNAAHGTHTMGTMVGGDAEGPLTPDVGVAPGARWMAAKGCEDFGCSESALLSAGQFILAPTKLDGTDPDPSMAPDIVNNSWGSGPGDPFYREVVQAWRAAGIMPVFSSGNPGPGCGDGGSPGDFPEAFSAGATDVDDQIAEFSGRGPSGFEDEKPINPDISAPGVDVVSTVPGGGYESFSGTSMAAPHASGTLALMLSAEPNLGMNAAFDAVRSAAVDRPDTTCGGDADGDPNNVYGDGRIDAAQAVALVATGGHLAGTVTDAGTSDPIPGATVLAHMGDRTYSATTDGAGEYLLFLPAGTWDVSVDAFGYETGVATGVEIVTDQTTTQDFALVALPRFTVTGTVRAAEDGTPIEGASVVALGTPVPPAVTDAAGTYALELPIGAYTLRASAGGCTAPELAEIASTTGGEVVVQDFALARKIDDFGHGCQPVPFTWDEVTTETALFGDEFVGRLTLPFAFQFYGESYDRIWIADNGYVNFLGPDQGNFVPVPIPTEEPPNAAIYALWQDLHVTDAGTILYGTLGTAPERRFVLEYRDVAVFGSDALLDFQIVLHEQGEVVELRYGDNPSAGNGSGATIGIEDHTGSDALQFGFHEDLLGSNVAYRYQPVPSGIVQGIVTDANDGQPVAGASVTATPGLGSTTTDSDGRYRLRLHPGTYTIEFAKAGYGTATRQVTVADGSDTTLDVSLEAPVPSLDRTAIEVTLALGATTTETVVLSNGGGLDLTWEAKERDLGSEPPILTTEAAGIGGFLERATRPVSRISNLGGRAPARPSSFQWTAARPTTAAGPTADLSVLLYADDPIHPAPNTFADQALQALGLSYTAHYEADFSGFVADLESGSWDLVIFANDNFLPDSAVFDALNGYVEAGGHLIAHTWAVGFDPGHPLWSNLGVTPVSDDDDPPDPVFWWQPNHPAFTFPESVPEPTQLDGGIFGVYGQRVEPTEGAEGIAGYTEPGPEPNEAALVLANGDRTAFKGFLDGQNSADLDEDGTLDGVELWTNLISGIGSGFFTDVPWLSESPSSGSVPPGGQQAVEITIGAAGLAPGTYHGAVVFLTNAPKNATQSVDVTLTVELPEDFGAASGAITDAHSGEPIGGATVSVHAQWPGTTPYEIVATTGADGSYRLIGPEGSWPADVAAPGHVAGALEVSIARGTTTAGQDATLHRDIPHAVLEGGEPIVAVLLPGETRTATLTLSNPEGHQPLTFSVGEVNLGGAVAATTGRRSLPEGADPNALTARGLPSAGGVDLPPRLQSPGDVITSWPTGLDLGWGVGYDGDVWLSDVLEAGDLCSLSDACVNAEFGTDGTPTGVIHDAGWAADWPADLAYDPGRGWLWQVQVGGDNAIVAWDPATGEVQETLTGSPWSGISQRGLAYDPAADVFYVGGWNEGIVYRVAGPSHPTPGETLNQCSPADPAISGLAWNSAFGKLWAATNSETDTIYLLDPTSCETEASLPHPDEGGFGGAGLEADGAGNLWTVGQASGQAYLIDSGLPNFSDVPWLSVEPTEGTVDPDASVAIEVTLDNAGLTTGLYEAQVVVQTNDPENAAFVVPVTLVVPAYRQGINAGGGAYTDTAGVSWAADQAWTEGSFGYVQAGRTRSVTGDIAGTEDDDLYRDLRQNMLAYRFSGLQAGTYLVDLRFAELNLRRSGARVFSVSLEGTTGVFLLDVFEEAGGARTALDRTFLVEVTDGTLDTVFTAVRGDTPIVNAIMVTHMPDGGP
jgi:subtilisin family serine protease